MSEPLQNIYLAFWNLDVKELPTVAAVRAYLSDNNLNPEHAADVAPSTALRRAADTFRTKENEAKCFTSAATQRLRSQIDELYEDDGKLRRRFLSQYELSEEGEPKHVAGKELDGFVVAFEEAISHYTGADLSKVLQQILAKDGLGTFSPRKGGGVYFVPVRPEAADLLQRIERFCNAVSVRFLTYTVPDTAAQRVEIANAIADSYHAEIALHAEYVAGYSLETKGGIVQNRREAIQATANVMSKLSGLMNGRYHELQNEIDGLLFKLTALTNEMSERVTQAQQAHQLGGGRRIVTTGV